MPVPNGVPLEKVTVVVTGTVAAWLSVKMSPLIPVTVVPAGIPEPVMEEPIATLVTAATVSEVEAELATLFVVVAVPR